MMSEKDLRRVNEFRTMTKDGREIWVSSVGARTVYQGRLAGCPIRQANTRTKREERRTR